MRSVFLFYGIRIIYYYSIRSIIVGICKIVPAHSLFLGLVRSYASLVNRRKLVLIPVVSLYCQQVHISLRTVTIAYGPAEILCKFCIRAEKHNRDPFIMQLYIPLHISLRNLVFSARFAAAYKEISFSLYGAGKLKVLPLSAVVAVLAGAVCHIPSA